MKRLILMLLAATLMGCTLENKFDNLKVDVGMAFPVGTYGITAEDFVDMLGLDVSDIAADKVIELTYADDAYNIIDENVIANIVKIDDQQNKGTFNLTSITANITPGVSRPLVIDDAVADIFSSNVKMKFKDGGRIKKVIFKNAVISFDATTNMPMEDLYVEFEGITQNGSPLRLNQGESIVLDDTYEVAFVVETDKEPYMPIAVKGSTVISGNSALEMMINLSDMDVKYIEGNLGKQVENGMTEFVLEGLSGGLKNVEEFYPENVIFNMKIDNAFEALPILVQITKITFVNADDVAKNVDIDIKNDLDVDRFFLKKGETNFVVDNSISKSGTGFSDAFSKGLSAVKIEYAVLINPSNEDAMGEVTQDVDNKVLVDTKINSSTLFKVPMKGYVKGIAIDTLMQVDFSIQDFDIKKLQYNISAINSFPLDLDFTLVIMEKETNNILSEEEEPVSIKGAETLTYDVSNIRTLSDDALDMLFEKKAYLAIRLQGNTIGADDKEIVSFMGGDNMTLSLFFGFNGVYTLVGGDE